MKSSCLQFLQFRKISRVAVIALLCLVLPVMTAAAPKPKHKWLGRAVRVGLVTAAAVADGITTQQCLRRGDVEEDPLLGSHPSPSRIYLSGAAVWVPAQIFLETRKHKRWAWIVDLTGAAIHGFLAFHNSQLP